MTSQHWAALRLLRTTTSQHKLRVIWSKQSSPAYDESNRHVESNQVLHLINAWWSYSTSCMEGNDHSSEKWQQKCTPHTFKWKSGLCPKLQKIHYCICQITTLPIVVLDILLSAYYSFWDTDLNSHWICIALPRATFRIICTGKQGTAQPTWHWLLTVAFFLTRGCFKSQNPKQLPLISLTESESLIKSFSHTWQTKSEFAVVSVVLYVHR